jgi:Mrp family chromosome partitioning ATPase
LNIDTIANGRLQCLMNLVESSFDWIIVDSPPAIQVPDACLANCCDEVLVVVHSHSTVRLQAAATPSAEPEAQ